MPRQDARHECEVDDHCLSVDSASGPGCGGCVAPLDAPFPAAPRVYDGVQVRISQTGLAFVEANLPQILDTLLADGLPVRLAQERTAGASLPQANAVSRR